MSATQTPLRVPAPRVFLVSYRGFHLVHAKRALGLRTLFQGTRRFTTPFWDRFGGPSSERISAGAFCACPAAWAFSSHDDDAIEPLTPLSPPSFFLVERTFVRIFRSCESRQDRFHRAPVMRLGLVSPRYLPSIRTLRMFQSPLQRWARDRRTSFLRDMPTAAWRLSHHARPWPVLQRLAPQPDSRRFFARGPSSLSFRNSPCGDAR